MALKLFAVLRVPVSVFCLLGFASASPGLGAWFCLGAYVYLGVVSVQLARARPGALKLAGLLVALESIGAVLFLLTADILAGRVSAPGAMVIAWAVGAAWATPNAVVLFLLRSKFVSVPSTRPLPPIEDRETARLKK